MTAFKKFYNPLKKATSSVRSDSEPGKFDAIAPAQSPTKQRSLTFDTLLHMSSRIALVVLCSTAVSYVHLKASLETGAKAQLEKYVAERGQRENELFSLAADNHRLVIRELRLRLGKRDRQTVQQQFDQLLDRWKDGSIRNAPAEQDPKTFDTETDPSVFIGPNTKLNPDLMDRVTVAYELARTHGPAWRNRFVNFYMTLPENAMVNYYPTGAWGLEIASTIDMPKESWFYYADAKHNPGRKTLWTLPYEDPATQEWLVTSATPIYNAENRLLMLIQQDVSLSQIFNRTINTRLDGTYNLILRQDGKLVAHPNLMAQIQSTGGDFDINKLGDQPLQRILKLVQTTSLDPVTRTAVIDSKVDGEFLAVTRLQATDWYFITVYPKSLLDQPARENAWFILMLGGIALVIEIATLAHVLSRKIAQPLRHLLNATEQLTQGRFDVALAVDRQDELGQLAGSFNTMSQQLQESFTTLEDKITERTAELETAKAETEQINQELEQRVLDRTAEVQAALEELERSQLQLVQSEKMSALGQLVAGVAHEINNPVGFIQGNLVHAKQYLAELLEHLERYQSGETPEAIANHAKAIDLDYLLTDLPSLLSSMSEGAERIREISLSLRVFSRADTIHPVEYEVSQNLDSTLLILKHRLKSEGDRPTIVVERNYAALPALIGYPGQLNQVFMNLLANAIDALDECFNQLGTDHFKETPPTIRIQTRQLDDQVEIQIQDNGMGISDQAKQRIFDYLFTTKAVGKGTGIGLAIARQIIVEKHGGRLWVDSHVGQGATFVIVLPMRLVVGGNVEAEVVEVTEGTEMTEKVMVATA
jgi:two-component system, NtrC family, sensor kinase